MTTQESRAAYVLEDLLHCSYCGNALRLGATDKFDDLVYRCAACPDDRSFPTMPADKLESWILREVTDAVMSDSNTRTLAQVLADAGDELPDYAPELLRDPVNHPEKVRAIALDPTIYTIPENIPQTRTLLSKLINRINLGKAEAVVHYALPLPQDSSLPGSHRQHLRLPSDGLD